MIDDLDLQIARQAQAENLRDVAAAFRSAAAGLEDEDNPIRLSYLESAEKLESQVDALHPKESS